MKYFAGIDAGQSATTAIVGDETGHALARGDGGPADEIGEGPDSTRLRDALASALAAAVGAAGLPGDTRFTHIVAGISGYEGRVYGVPPELPAQNLTLRHDAPVAHAGAFGGEPGIVVIAGTGSAAYGVDHNGNEAMAGGWGFAFGDEGSGFWLAAQAIARAMRAADSRKETSLAGWALEYFGARSLRELARSFYSGEISRARLATFAARVIEAAQRGDEEAAQLVRAGARELVGAAMHVRARLAMAAPPVAFLGGLMRSAALRDRIADWMRQLAPDCGLVEPRYDPTIGALLLAYRASGIVPSSAVGALR